MTPFPTGPGLWGFGYWRFHPRWGYDAFGPPVDIVTHHQI